MQEAKIDSLGIRDLFTNIVIDDPIEGAGGKAAAFKQVLDELRLPVSSVLVVGDNPDTEIAAAKRLQLPYALLNRSDDYPNAFKSYRQLVEHFF